MAVDWPATLPQQPSDYSEDPSPITVRSQPDSGPSKSRKRFTKAKRTGQMTFLLTIAQRNILDAFFFNDLDGGAVQMNFVHPWTGVTNQMLIKKEPSYSSDGPLGVRAVFTVEFF